MNFLQFFGRKKTFSHGIHPPEYKETHYKETRRLPFPPHVILLLGQSIGKPAVSIVHKGQHVERGELIAKADGFVSVPLYASVTGTVKGIELVLTARGTREPAIIIETMLSSGQRQLDGVQRDLDTLSRQDLIKAVCTMGMVGLGGAAFPTHVKMSIPKDCNIHTVLINGCECEPFLTTDHRVMLEQVNHLIRGIKIAMKSVDAPKAIIGIESNKLNVLEAIKPHLPTDGSITIEAVVTKYPQGAEKMLATALLGVEIPSKGLPSEIGLAIFNVTTLAEIGRLLPQGQALIERIVTVTGDDLEKPGNYQVPIGTPLGHILEYAGFTGDEAELILGGPMMGMSAASLDVPTTKGTGGLLVLDKRATKNDDIMPCIKCSRCLQACPINLNPSELGLLAAKRQYDVMEEKYNLNDCFDCGCCSYVCPSNIPLVQYFRIAKTLNRQRHQ
ncbi:MAG: electron transport complex subunit RsxC [Methylococcales bacterium]|nr:electron transport complex subunit RsxC [Methylococcales bacterium]